MTVADVRSVCEFLEWDSAWFGVRIGRVCGRHLSADVAAAVIRWADENRVDCLYLLVDAEHQSTIRLAEQHGFALVDLRIELVAPIHPNLEARPSGTIRPACDDDLPRLTAIARASHHNTRFYVDGRFDRARCDELYARWIERSVAGELADVVWVAEGEGAPCGYLAARAASAVEGCIGLVAVDGARRGSGFGTALLAAAKHWCAEQELSHLSVVTQGVNPAAIRFYERAGFTVRAVQFWYHRWSSTGR